MVKTCFGITLLALFFPFLAFAQVDLSEVEARYASINEERIKERLDEALPRSYVELEYYEGAIARAVEEYNYCEAHCKKVYMLRFVIDWPLYKKTGEIKLIIDNNPERYNILYIDDSLEGKDSFRSVLVSIENNAEIHIVRDYNKTVLWQALSYNPRYILAFVHSIFDSYVFVVDDKLLCYEGDRLRDLDFVLKNHYEHFECTHEKDMASPDFAR